MARATRSSTQHEKIADPSPPPRNKKRKRTAPENDDLPPHKLLRHDTDIKLEPTSSPEPHAGDLALDPLLARSILDILESSDSQGLLDRVFPLAAHPAASLSLRTLLTHPHEHTLSVLRAAVQHLVPVSSHARSLSSGPAALQLRFCSLALSLLDQASLSVPSVPLHLHSILDTAPAPPSPSAPKRKYALMQHLPTGDYWSSLSAEVPSTPSCDLKDLPVGFAELVAVLPTPPSTTSTTLGSYNLTRSAASQKILPTQRRVTTGAFLDYGPWASFAPSFDHDAQIAGRRQLGEVVMGWDNRKRLREQVMKECTEDAASILEIADIEMGDKKEVDVDTELDGLLPPDDIASIKSALGSLELENAVQELLDRNRRALQRLEELQFWRLTNEGGASTVEEGSEEWDTAQGIMESLTILTSLRPRCSTSTSAPTTVLPLPSILRKLHRTLALAPTPGWHGTLSTAHKTALRDDSTVKLRSGTVVTIPTAVTAPAPAPGTPAPTTATATGVSTQVPAPYAAYPYAYTAQQGQVQPSYRTTNLQPTAVAGAYTPYKPGQTPVYYQGGTSGATAYAQAGAAGTGMQGAQGYYTGYGGGTSGQQPYAAYSSWYSQYPGGNSGRGTPVQGVGTAGAGVGATYGGFFQGAGASSMPVGQRTPVVANTVAKPQQPQGQGQAWGGYAQAQGQSAQADGGVALTLPSHLRGGAGAGNVIQQQQPSYYGTFMQPPGTNGSAAR